MSRIFRKLLSIAVGAAALLTAAVPANAWYVVHYIDSQGYWTGYHYYCDDGSDFPYGGPIYGGYNTGYSYYYEYHTGEYSEYPWC